MAQMRIVLLLSSACSVCHYFHTHMCGALWKEKRKGDGTILFFLRFVKPQLAVGENQGVDPAYLKSCS